MKDADKIRAVLLTVLDEEHAEGVLEHRSKTIRKPFTVFAAKLLVKEFGKCINPNRAAEEMILRNWQGFSASWLPPSEHRGAKPSASLSLFEAHGGRHVPNNRNNRADEIGAAFDRRYGPTG